MKVRQPRKPSNKASSPLKKKRARLLEKCRHLLSGRGRMAAIEQQSSELRLMKKKKRTLVFKKTGLKTNAIVDRNLSLAMKSTMGISWAQHRSQKRFLKSVGISFDCEKWERHERDKITNGIFTSEIVTVKEKNEKNAASIDGFCETKVPCVYITDLPKFVENLLQEYNTQGKLNWLKGQPDDELWLKVLGVTMAGAHLS